MGLPRALHYFYHGKAWEAFLRSLGAEVTVSGPTDAAVMEKGFKLCMRDLCLPVKAFIGQIALLAGRCDRIFVPRLVSRDPSRYYCPKFLALPDLAAVFVPPESVISVEINAKKGPGFSAASYAALARALGADSRRAAEAADAMGEAERDMAREKAAALAGFAAASGPRIAVLGHPYMARDSHLSSGVVRWFADRGSSVAMYDDLPIGEFDKVESRLFRDIYWESAWEIYRAAAVFCRPGSADGVVILSAFGCGPDSFTADLVAMKCRDARMPMVRLVMDEHSSMLGVETRLEAFMDMIAMRAGRAPA